MIKILGKSYTVRKVHGNGLPSDIIGNINQRFGEISIISNMSCDMFMTTLLHEVLHGIDDALKLELTENQVAGLASSLFCFFTENSINLSRLESMIDG